MNGSRVHLSGAITFGAPIGDLCNVYATTMPGSPPHIVAQFLNGFRLELNSASAAELARRLPEALAGLKGTPDVSGSAYLHGEPL